MFQTKLLGLLQLLLQLINAVILSVYTKKNISEGMSLPLYVDDMALVAHLTDTSEPMNSYSPATSLHNTGSSHPNSCTVHQTSKTGTAQLVCDQDTTSITEDLSQPLHHCLQLLPPGKTLHGSNGPEKHLQKKFLILSAITTLNKWTLAAFNRAPPPF